MTAGILVKTVNGNEKGVKIRLTFLIEMEYRKILKILHFSYKIVVDFCSFLF